MSDTPVRRFSLYVSFDNFIVVRYRHYHIVAAVSFETLDSAMFLAEEWDDDTCAVKVIDTDGNVHSIFDWRESKRMGEVK
jgi:hypothetical protein